jgi:uncharacterized protein with von Willebrand factor type A (vWA) domain
MKELTIYRLRYYDDNTDYYFKGIDRLRDFAKERINDGWYTNTTEEDLDDDDKLIDFIENDYGEELTRLMTITSKDLEI